MATLEFTVNAPNPSSDNSPSATTLADGSFVVTYSSNLNSNTDIFFQRFTADGIRTGAQTIANTETGSAQFVPAIAGLANGGFVVVWQGPGLGSSGDIFGQRFSETGQMVGPEFAVNATQAGSQGDPAVAALEDGGWVVVWEDFGLDGDQIGIFQQRYNFLGVPVGDETRVNFSTLDRQDEPSVSGLKNGGWVVVWTSEHLGNNDSTDSEVFFQRFNADGTRAGGETRVSPVNGSTNDDASSVATLANGDFVVAWAQNRGGDARVFTQVFRENGTARSNIREISDPNVNAVQSYPEVAALDDGGFAVVWQGFDGFFGDVFRRTFNANGEPRGPAEIAGSSDHDGSANETAITALAGGGFGTFWSGDTGDIVGSLTGRGTDLEDIEFMSQAGIYRALAGNDYVRGSSGNDEIFGGSGSDRIEALDGDDFISTGSSNFSILEYAHGGTGNDTILGGSGRNDLRGGSGIDVIDGKGSSDVIRGGSDADVLKGGSGNDTLFGDRQNDVLSGGSGDDELRGGRGNDVANGGLGDDLIFGENGNDTLRGREGDDVINAGTGADRINGGAGDDILSGGPDSSTDVFVFNSLEFGDDVVTDFDNGRDRFDMRGSGASAFGDLEISNTGNDALIEIGDNSILVLGADGLINGSDFIF